MIPAERFLVLVRSLGLEGELLRHAMSRIREGEAWRAEMAALPAGPRVVRTLLRLAAPARATPVDVGLDQTELGQAAGLARSTVAAELARLRDQGLVATSRRRRTPRIPYAGKPRRTSSYRSPPPGGCGF